MDGLRENLGFTFGLGYLNNTAVVCAFRIIFCDRSLLLAHVYGLGWFNAITLATLAASFCITVWPRNAHHPRLLPPPQLPRPLSAGGVRAPGPSAQVGRIAADKCPAGPSAGLRRAVLGPHRGRRSPGPRPGRIDALSADVSHPVDCLLRLAAVAGGDRPRGHLGCAERSVRRRRRCDAARRPEPRVRRAAEPAGRVVLPVVVSGRVRAQVDVRAACLLYTSDAADE